MLHTCPRKVYHGKRRQQLNNMRGIVLPCTTLNIVVGGACGIGNVIQTVDGICPGNVCVVVGEGRLGLVDKVGGGYTAFGIHLHREIGQNGDSPDGCVVEQVEIGDSIVASQSFQQQRVIVGREM